LTLGGIPGRVIPDPNLGALVNGSRQGFFPFIGSSVSNLSAGDVNSIITRAAQGAYRQRAAIRIPLASPTEVNICVVDTSGLVLGQFSTQDAPQFGQDVSCQKARAAVFFSSANADSQLRSVNGFIDPRLGIDITKYANAAQAFGVPLNGTIAFSARAVGFLSQPTFPSGIVGTTNGPFSKPFPIWSVFNTGLQLALDKPALVNILTNGALGNRNIGCSPIPGDLTLANGLQIFAGSSPLYRNGMMIGAIGISGDGIEQDDFIGATGAIGFEAPANIRSDQLILQKSVRLPFVKYPRHPNIGNPPPPPIIRRSGSFANTN
jgi:uncharacterized protein GlcG (DUF336 family)